MGNIFVVILLKCDVYKFFFGKKFVVLIFMILQWIWLPLNILFNKQIYPVIYDALYSLNLQFFRILMTDFSYIRIK